MFLLPLILYSHFQSIKQKMCLWRHDEINSILSLIIYYLNVLKQYIAKHTILLCMMISFWVFWTRNLYSFSSFYIFLLFHSVLIFCFCCSLRVVVMFAISFPIHIIIIIKKFSTWLMLSIYILSLSFSYILSIKVWFFFSWRNIIKWPMDFAVFWVKIIKFY